MIINYCNFTGNTPISTEMIWKAQGGALFGKLRQIAINNTCFIKNKNYAGGAIYIEQHAKYSQFIGRLSNVMALYNWANDDGSFVYLSPGLLSAEFLVESSFFNSNRALGCNFIDLPIF